MDFSFRKDSFRMSLDRSSSCPLFSANGWILAGFSSFLVHITIKASSFPLLSALNVGWQEGLGIFKAFSVRLIEVAVGITWAKPTTCKSYKVYLTYCARILATQSTTLSNQMTLILGKVADSTLATEYSGLKMEACQSSDAVQVNPFVLFSTLLLWARYGVVWIKKYLGSTRHLFVAYSVGTLATGPVNV